MLCGITSRKHRYSPLATSEGVHLNRHTAFRRRKRYANHIDRSHCISLVGSCFVAPDCVLLCRPDLPSTLATLDRSCQNS